MVVGAGTEFHAVVHLTYYLLFDYCLKHWTIQRHIRKRLKCLFPNINTVNFWHTLSQSLCMILCVCIFLYVFK